MTKLAFDTTAGPWTFDDTTYVDHVELEDADPGLVRAAAHAHSAGAITVSEGLDLDHVEPDEVSLAKLADAMGDWVEPIRDPETGEVTVPGRWSGPWHEGHAVQQKIDADHRASRLSDEIPDEIPDASQLDEDGESA